MGAHNGYYFRVARWVYDPFNCFFLSISLAEGVIVKKIAVLLTATVDISGIPFSVIENKDFRKGEYLQAFGRWFSQSRGVRFIICENSGYDFSSDITRLGLNSGKNEIEILNFHGQGFDRNLGKGYGEMLTFQYVARHSKIFTDSDLILKVNGRYYLHGLSKLVSAFQKAGDCEIFGNFKTNLTWLDSRVFAFTPRFFQTYFSPFKSFLNDSEGRYFEHALARATHLSIAEGFEWRMLPSNPVLSGRSGTTGSRYSRLGVRRFLKGFYLWVLRRLVSI